MCVYSPKISSSALQCHLESLVSFPSSSLGLSKLVPWMPSGGHQKKQPTEKQETFFSVFLSVPISCELSPVPVWGGWRKDGGWRAAGKLRANGEHREKENMKGVCNVFMDWFLVLLTCYGGDASEICIRKSFSDPCLLSPLGEQYSLGVSA